MNIVVIVTIIVTILVLKMVYDYFAIKKEIRKIYEELWGRENKDSMTRDRMDAISGFYDYKKDKQFIDDITWNDLDMDLIYQLFNHTSTSPGEEYLYYQLRTPIVTRKERNKREDLIQLFLENEEVRREVAQILIGMGKQKSLSFFAGFQLLKDHVVTNKFMDYLCFSALILSIVSLGFIGLYAIAVIGFVFFFNMITYYIEKNNISAYYQFISYLLHLLNGIQKLSHCKSDFPKEYQEQIATLYGKFSGFKRGSFLIFPSQGGGGSIFDILLDYIRMVFHVDLMKFNSMISFIQKNEDVVEDIFHTIGFIDSQFAIASHRAMLGPQGYAIPEFTNNNKIITFEIDNMRHPLIFKGVANSFKYDGQGALLTGSNASGKSTFLKGIALNAILAQTINTAYASRYYGCEFMISSSMAIQDNIVLEESYFVAEIKSIHRILGEINEDYPVLCIIDEVLRGTNTEERIAASSQILKNISQQNTLCFAATHDIELADILSHYFTNYYFTDQIIEDEIYFDYLLRKGKSNSQNAISLLELFGYNKEVIKQARESIVKYETGEKWPVLE